MYLMGHLAHVESYMLIGRPVVGLWRSLKSESLSVSRVWVAREYPDWGSDTYASQHTGGVSIPRPPRARHVLRRSLTMGLPRRVAKQKLINHNPRRNLRRPTSCVQLHSKRGSPRLRQYAHDHLHHGAAVNLLST